MIKLNFLTDDEHHVELLQAYWAQDEKGRWLNKKLTPIATLCDIPVSEIHEFVEKHCHVVSDEIYCVKCKEVPRIFSRPHYKEMRDRMTLAVYPGTRLRGMCKSCADEEREADQLRRANIELKRKELVLDWLVARELETPAADHQNASLFDIFLVDGLVRYAGNAWRSYQLADWNSYQPSLCRTPEDIRFVYRHLFLNGWILPHPDTPTSLFVFENEQVVGFDELGVSWLFRPDLFSLFEDEVLAAFERRLQSADTPEYEPLWRWVCMAELRHHFSYQQKIRPRTTKGWSDAARRNLEQILNAASLAEARSVVSLCFYKSGAALSDTRHQPYKVINWIPGSFLTTFDWHRSNGRPIETKERLFTGPEGLYTGHFFDHVLQVGDDGFQNITGESFKASFDRDTSYQ